MRLPCRCGRDTIAEREERALFADGEQLQLSSLSGDRTDVTLRRFLTSWYAFVAVLLLVGVACLTGLTALLGQVEARSEASAIDTARIVAALTVHRNVTEREFKATAGLTPADVGDLDADVAALVAEQRLAGLEVWSSDGRLLYGDANHPTEVRVLPPDELARMLIGLPWVTAHATEREMRTTDVYLPYEAGTDPTPDGLVKVLIPEANLDAAVADTTRQLYLLALLLLAVGGLGLSMLRRRMARHDHEATHDRLTGLLNWGGFRDTLHHSITSGRVGPDRLGALLLIDLDGFKSVNDTLGHPAGDVLLMQVGHELRSSVRPQDIVARLGGDEFAILLTGLSERSDATQVASKMLDRLRSKSFDVEGIGLSADASIGVVLIPTHGADIDVLFRRVDVAMYQAKGAGAGVAIYDEATDPHDVDELNLLAQLRRAIDNDELVLHYQPKAEITDRRVEGVEALVRWQHPTRGLLAPGAFIPQAESTGLLGPLTHWVLGRAIDDAARWHRGGLPLSVAVNVSPRTLLDGSLPGTILDLLASSELPSHLLEIEITETAIMTDPQRALNVLRQLRAMGIRLSIDDFGSGYTSLSYLKTLPVNTLKIDRSFITDLAVDDQDRAVTQSVIDLGHRLGLSVLAEGIETEETWNQLRGLGCDEGQGFLLARPMPAEQIEGWISAHQDTPEHDQEMSIPAGVPG
jgi:diguanylate cyclase